MAYTYEEVIPTPIENAKVEKMLNNGVLSSYRVTPNEGYVLHDNRADEEVIDTMTMQPTGGVILRYSIGSKTVRYDYDFDTVVPDVIQDINGNDIAVNKIGSFEQFAVLKSLIPQNQTFGG